MRIAGVCPKCGHKETREVDKPDEWLINLPIWTWCHGIGYGGHLSGIIFDKELQDGGTKNPDNRK